MALTKERLKKWFFQRYKFTRQSVLVTFLSIAIFALTLYFMNVMANVASYLSPNNTTTPKLSDRLFDAIPSITVLWLTDLADALLFVPTILLVLTHYRPLYLLCKVLLTWALCNLMRITTVAITSFPDPRNGCQHTVGEFFTTFQLHRCGDCMFSGHTVIFVISALVWTSHGYHRFPRRYRWLAWIVMLFVWALCIGSALIVIANRAHYTVDVLVAFYVAGGNWYLLTGPDPRPHAREREARLQRQLEAGDPEKNGAPEDQLQAQPVDAVVAEKEGEEKLDYGTITGHDPVMLESIAGEIQAETGQSSRNNGRGICTC
ncbi:sphingomyelin synthase [Podila epicladia]|nr:sphingomyelin synthase [Podila epicladia]